MYNKQLITQIIPTLRFEFPYSIDEYAEHMYFENYHKHTCESNHALADSAETYTRYVDRIKEVNSKCLFSGEHGWQGDHIATYDLAQNVGLKYRHSCEAYWVKDRLIEIDGKKDGTNCHMMIVAKTAKGRKRLNYILSIANIDGFYKRARIDLPLLLNESPDDFIVTSACFKKGTKVTTDSGLKPIETVSSNDKVLNRFGEWETINHLTQIGYNGIGYHIKTNAFDEDIICTEDHKFLTTSINNIKKSPKWVSANKLRIKDVSPHTKDKLLHPLVTKFNGKSVINKSDFDGAYKKVSHSWSVKQKMNDVVELTPEMMRLLGVFIGDGSIDVGHKNDRICFTLNLEDYYYFKDDFISPVENQIGIKFNVGIREKNHRVDLSTSSVDFINFIYYLFGNCKASTKHIPERLKHISYELDCELIYGLIISDGYIRKSIREGYESGEMVLATISPRLCSDFRRLCADIGCLVSKRTVEEHTDKNGTHHNISYYLTMSSKEILKVNKKQHTSHADVVYTFKHFYNNMKRNPRRIIDGQEYLVVTIKEMGLINLQETVYCLNNDSHSFVAGGCIVHNCIAGWNYTDADEIWLKIAKHFGNNFFLEVQNHNTDKQKALNKHILNLAREHNLQIIAGLDTHYVNADGAKERDALLESKDIQYLDEQGWYMDFPDVDTIIKRFEEQGILSEEEIYRAIMNTNIFVDDCEEIVLDKSFKIPNIHRDKSYDERVQIYKNLLNEAYKKEKVHSPERVEGIRAEAKEVIDSGVVDYFILNHALIDCSVNEYGGILTTTSRGSMGSFYTNKLLGSTTIDRFNCEIPIFYPRFLTADRVLAGSMPDEDYNLAEQEPFVKAAKKLLGEHGCYPLMAVEKFKPKSAWKMYSRVNNIEPEKANEVSKAIDNYLKACKEAGDDADSIDITEYIPKQYLSIYNESVKYQGVVSNFKVHACGHLLFDGDIREEIGLMSAVSESTHKRTVCACVQGGYLDTYGYVKDDFLIVDAVSLTYELFQSIGREVPTFDELREMVSGDQPTWDIYAKGATCCVNQLERDGTKHNMMEYKATNMQELSAFIAAIRPAFKSLLRTFIERKPYSTGEPKIDELLEDTAHFMLYQESIMKVLSFLGLPMGETYGVIKAISKKKLKGEKKEKLEAQLKENWNKIFGNLDNFQKVWDIINDAGRYAFNAPHSLSMCGDSLYQAWFKAHYPSKFYEIAISHYQRKENKDKISALITEAATYFDYTKLPFRFRQDNRTVSVNDKTKEITMCLYSIKGISKSASDILFEYKDAKFNSFLDVIKTIPLDKTTYEALIKLDYFTEFGKSAKLLAIYNLYRSWSGRKSIKKTSTEPFSIELLNQFCSKETTSQYVFDDIEPLINEYVKSIPDEDISQKEKIEAQLDHLSYVQATGLESDRRIGYVRAVYPCKRKADNKTWAYKVSVTFLGKGKDSDLTIYKARYDKCKLQKGDIFYAESVSPKDYQGRRYWYLMDYKKI